MDENARKKVLEMIRTAIDEMVYDEIRQKPSKDRARQEEIKKTKAQVGNDAHDALFGSEEEQFTHKLNLFESKEKPKISPTESSQFEEELNKSLVKFNVTLIPQKIAGVDRIISFPRKNNKTDALIFGAANVGNNENLKFSISLLNGLQMNSKDIKMDDETKKFIDVITNLYNSTLKEKLSAFTSPKGQDAGEMAPPNAAPEIPAQAPAAPPPAA